MIDFEFFPPIIVARAPCGPLRLISRSYHRQCFDSPTDYVVLSRRSSTATKSANDCRTKPTSSYLLVARLLQKRQTLYSDGEINSRHLVDLQVGLCAEGVRVLPCRPHRLRE